MRIQPTLPLLICLLPFVTPIAMACDCNKFPFQPNPPCEEICYAAMLNESSSTDLNSVLGLPKDLSVKIGRINMASPKNPTWEGYKQRLTTREFALVTEVLKDLDDDKVAILRTKDLDDNTGAKANEESDPVTESLKKLRKNNVNPLESSSASAEKSETSPRNQ